MSFPKIQLLLLLFLPMTSAASNTCPGNCRCQWINGLPTADCSNLNLTSIPVNIPSNVLVLDLSGNQILHVTNSTFLLSNLVHLIKLDLSHCGITTIDSSAFTGMSNLRELNLDGNSISQLPSAIFADIRGLRVLSLRFNRLATIPNYAFDTMSQLETLDLQNSQITHIDQEGFRGLENLRSLQVNGNQLRRLTLPTLITLKSLQQLDLHNNPWNCDCHVRDVNRWMQQRNVGGGYRPTCVEPEMFRGVAWDAVPTDKYACIPEVLSIEAFNILPGQNISIECAVFGDPIPQVTWFYEYYPVDSLNQSKYERFSHNFTSHVLHVLIIRNASEVDGGNYRCFASNWAGNTTGTMPLFQSSGLLTAAETTILLIALVIGILLVIGAVIYCWKYKRGSSSSAGNQLSRLWKRAKNPAAFIQPQKFNDVTYFKTSDAMLTPPAKQPEETTLLLLKAETGSVDRKETITNPPPDIQNRSYDVMTAALPHCIVENETVMHNNGPDHISSVNSEEDKDSGIQHEEDSSVRNESSTGNGICTPQDIFTDSDHESSVVKPRHVTFSPTTFSYVSATLRRSPAPSQQQQLKINNCLQGYDPYLGTEV